MYFINQNDVTNAATHFLRTNKGDDLSKKVILHVEKRFSKQEQIKNLIFYSSKDLENTEIIK